MFATGCKAYLSPCFTVEVAQLRCLALASCRLWLRGAKQSAQPSGIMSTVSFQIEVDRLQLSLSASNRRNAWLRQRLVCATKAKSTAVQVWRPVKSHSCLQLSFNRITIS